MFYMIFFLFQRSWKSYTVKSIFFTYRNWSCICQKI